ncbi:MAG: hypothetical protein IT364_14195 [Candidatus Hydrogenedentes bacterium]|nr:hypothetical protein [Candidatus Hydrogenedentota bacterium]
MPSVLFKSLKLAFLVVVLCKFTFAQGVPLDPQSPLRWSVYMTSDSVEQIARDSGELALAIERTKALNISRVFLEVFRGGLVSEQDATAARDAMLAAGFEVAGGIATVPGGEYGVRQEGPLDWLNWQNEKTQNDLRRVSELAARVFDTVIIDDFFCTGDVSAESNAARGDRSWSEYRRELLGELATSLFIEPAQAVKPNITMIIKYPQWYDRFHEFGYDVARTAPLFDRVWVGTETRGAMTQRYGFVQPYEGFVNYRWIASIAGSKIAGAWFDHGDCDGIDFIDQAYQSVLAGAPEIVLFCYAALREGHPGHPLLVDEQKHLAALAQVVRANPVWGVAAYKPVNSDAGGELFIMDTIGMLGVPLVPVSLYPSDAKVVFLPTQAAADPELPAHIEKSIAEGKTLVLTAGLLDRLGVSIDTAPVAGVSLDAAMQRMKAQKVYANGQEFPLANPLDLAGGMACGEASALIEAEADGRHVPLLTRYPNGNAVVYVLNTFTFSQADYDAVGEVLLPPRLLGLLELPRSAANILRAAFSGALGIAMDGPARVTLQPLGDGSLIVQNYTIESHDVIVTLPVSGPCTDRLDGSTHTLSDGRLSCTLAARSRRWLAPAEMPAASQK